jgi:hypothetical protein
MLGIPVEIIDNENLYRLLRCEDYIGIIEERGDIIHRYGDVFDRRHLPHKSASFIKKIIWEPIMSQLFHSSFSPPCLYLLKHRIFQPTQPVPATRYSLGILHSFMRQGCDEDCPL